MDFGTIKNIFVENYKKSLSGLDNGEGKELFKLFLKEVKNNKTLKTGYITYNSIENKKLNDRVEAGEYLNEHIDILKTLKPITEEVKGLVKILNENGLVNEERETSELHKSIHNLFVNFNVSQNTKNKINNLDSIFESKCFLVNHLLSENTEIKKEYTCESCDNTFEGVIGEGDEEPNKCPKCESEVKEDLRVEGLNPYKFKEIALKKYNEKYKKLSESEVKLLKTLTDGSEQEKIHLMNTIISENIVKINEKLNNPNSTSSLKLKLSETKDYIYTLNVGKNNIEDRIIKLYEINKVL